MPAFVHPSPQRALSTKAATASASASAPWSRCDSTWKRQQAVAALDLDRQLADLDAVPADELPARLAGLRPER